MKFVCQLFLILVLWQSNDLCSHTPENRISKIPFEAIAPRVDSRLFISSEVFVLPDGSSSVFVNRRKVIPSQFVFEYNSQSRLEALMSRHQQTGLIGFR